MDDLIASIRGLYEETKLPVILLDEKWDVLWANRYALENAPLLCNPEYLRELYLQDSESKLLPRLKRGEVLRIGMQRFLGEPMQLTLCPCLRNGKLHAVEAHFLPEPGQNGEDGIIEGNDYAEQTIDLVISKLREPLSDLFALLDPLSRSVERYPTGKTSLLYNNELTPRFYKLLSNIINIGEYSRCMNGVASLKLKRKDLTSHLQTLCDAADLFLLGAGLKLRFESEIEQLPVCADFDKLDVAVLNVLYNACAHSHKGDEVRISLSRRGDNALITLSDSGEGMANDQLETAFTSLHYSEEDGFFTGNPGVGLAVVKRIMQLHGGSVALSSVPGRGTTVSLQIPLREDVLLKPEYTEELRIGPSPYLKDRFSNVYIFLSGLKPAEEKE